jgi:hypothetical protein
VYAFGADIPSANPTIGYQWPIAANSPGFTRKNIGTGFYPIAVTPVGNATAQIIAVTIQIPEAGSPIFTLYTASIPEANLFTFTHNDLKQVGGISDPDKGPVGQNAGFISSPGYAAVIGPGASAGHTGLNFILIDAANAQIVTFIGGTGQNLLPGSTIAQAAMDFAPTLTEPIAYDVAWMENKIADSGAAYQAIYYEKLVCGPH